MKAVVVHRSGGPDELRLEEVADPEPSAGEVRIAVTAAGTDPVDAGNRADGSWARIEFRGRPSSSGLVAGAGVDIHDDFMPGLKDAIVGRQVIGPWQMENEWGLIGGNIFHGELSPGRLFHMRPATGYAAYRTPIRGLYQASSATHAGGGVTGLAGHRVVREIVRDRRRERFRRRGRGR